MDISVFLRFLGSKMLSIDQNFDNAPNEDSEFFWCTTSGFELTEWGNLLIEVLTSGSGPRYIPGFEWQNSEICEFRWNSSSFDEAPEVWHFPVKILKQFLCYTALDFLWVLRCPGTPLTLGTFVSRDKLFLECSSSLSLLTAASFFCVFQSSRLMEKVIEQSSSLMTLFYSWFHLGKSKQLFVIVGMRRRFSNWLKLWAKNSETPLLSFVPPFLWREL